MTPLRIFISSVQTEFAQERAALRDYLRGDPLMRRFFEVFMFEEVPASDRRPDALYLDEVERCDLYVGVFGNEYGTEDEEGVSPTEREFDNATTMGTHRLIFVKGVDDRARNPKMQTLIEKWSSPDFVDTNSVAYVHVRLWFDFGSVFEEMLLVKGIPGCCAFDVCYKKSRGNRRWPGGPAAWIRTRRFGESIRF